MLASQSLKQIVTDGHVDGEPEEGNCSSCHFISHTKAHCSNITVSLLLGQTVSEPFAVVTWTQVQYPIYSAQLLMSTIRDGIFLPSIHLPLV